MGPLDGYIPPLMVLAAAALFLALRRVFHPRGKSAGTVVIIVLIIALAGGLMLAMNRTPFYKYGAVRIWSGNIWSNQNSQQISDPYTFTHIIHGFGFYGMLKLAAPRSALGTRAILAIAAESAWEVLENTDMVINRYREATISLDYYGDSVVNATFDIIAMTFGFWFAAYFRARSTLIATVVIEVILLLLIRDNLTLNIIMLLYPLDAIKSWQSGV